MKTDQYFKPGDKVMLVSKKVRPGKVLPSPTGKYPTYGQVYCVEDFWEGPQFNVLMLVGFGGWSYGPNGWPVGWEAALFRKVDEIKMIVAAVNQQPVREAVPAQQDSGGED